MKIFAIFISAVIVLLSANAHAQEQGLICSSDRVVYYINGVLTVDEGAAFSSALLEESYLTQYPDDEHPVRFKYLHNPSGRVYLYGAGGALDFIEVAMQLTGLSMSRLFRMFAGLEIMPEEVAQVLAGPLSDAAVRGYNADATTLNRMLGAINSDIGEGSRVAVVSHSQGNLWSNSVMALIQGERRQSVGQVGVAVPDSRMVNSRVAHTTLTDDLVIRPIPFALSPNVDNQYSLYEVCCDGRTFGHSFNSAYLENGKPSFGRIISLINSTMEGLVPISGAAGQGPLTVTLTWGAQPDVDLHVSEPSGFHVYYASPAGPSGYLDVDDVTSFGPEHYYTSCTSLVPGNYRVGVNYYYGAGPETATVTIKAGTANYTGTVALPVARGSSGDSSPITVADVLVERDQNTGNIQATITPR